MQQLLGIPVISEGNHYYFKGQSGFTVAPLLSNPFVLAGGPV